MGQQAAFVDVPLTPQQLKGPASSYEDVSLEKPSAIDPNTVGTYLRHLWTGINPVSNAAALPVPKALGGAGMDSPVLPQNIAQQMHDVKLKADEAWDKGDKVTAAAKYVESIIPMLGPWMSKQGDQWQQGNVSAALGDTTALAATVAAPSVGPKVIDAARKPIGTAMSATGSTIESVAKSPQIAKMSELGAVGELLMKGDIKTAVAVAAIPKAAEYVGVGLRNLGDMLRASDTLTAREIANLRVKLNSDALAKNPQARAVIEHAIRTRGGKP